MTGSPLDTALDAAVPAPDASLHLAQTSVAPPPGPADPGGQGEDFGKSSPLGFLILVLFFIAVAFLIRSMTKHLKRLPESFDDKPAGEDAGAVDDADGAPSPTPDTKP